MEMKHLSDEQIQDYLDGNLKDEKTMLKKHLSQCPKCAQEIEIYNAIYSEAKNDLGFELSADFAEKLSAEISKPTFFSRIQEALIPIAALLTLVATFVYFFDYSNIINSFTMIFNLNLQSSLTQIVQFNSNATGLVVTCILGIILIILVDQLYKHRRNKSTFSLFSI